MWPSILILHIHTHMYTNTHTHNMQSVWLKKTSKKGSELVKQNSSRYVWPIADLPVNTNQSHQPSVIFIIYIRLLLTTTISTVDVSLTSCFDKGFYWNRLHLLCYSSHLNSFVIFLAWRTGLTQHSNRKNGTAVLRMHLLSLLKLQSSCLFIESFIITVNILGFAVLLFHWTM